MRWDCGKSVAEGEARRGGSRSVFLAAPGNDAAQVELTYNWDQPRPYAVGRNFGHLAYEVDDIYATCQRLMEPA